MAARMIAGYLSNKGKVVEIEGIPGTSAAHDRGSGFNRELNNYPDISVVAREAANFDREQAALFIRRIQRKGIVFDAVFAHNDAMILGALDELDKPDEPGKTGADKILVGYDAIKEAVSAVKEGKLTATIAQKPKEMGALSVKAAAQFFRGDPVDQFIPVDLSPVSLKKNDAGNTAP